MNQRGDHALRDIAESNPRRTAREIEFRTKVSHSAITRVLVGTAKKMEERAPHESSDIGRQIPKELFLVSERMTIRWKTHSYYVANYTASNFGKIWAKRQRERKYS